MHVCSNSSECAEKRGFGLALRSSATPDETHEILFLEREMRDIERARSVQTGGGGGYGGHFHAA
jgi:hypothetical protein